MIEEKLKLKSTKILGFKIIKYRIVTDSFAGYECQKWRLWFPIWTQMGFCNTHSTLERAVKYINTNKVILTS